MPLLRSRRVRLRQRDPAVFEIIDAHGGEGLEARGVFLDAEAGEIEFGFADGEDVPAHEEKDEG